MADATYLQTLDPAEIQERIRSAKRALKEVADLKRDIERTLSGLIKSRSHSGARWKVVQGRVSFESSEDLSMNRPMEVNDLNLGAEDLERMSAAIRFEQTNMALIDALFERNTND